MYSVADVVFVLVDILDAASFGVNAAYIQDSHTGSCVYLACSGARVVQ